MSQAVILLVDDEKTVLTSLKNQLRNRYGRRFAYETAENADEAWEVIDELEDEGVRIVVIVSDWLMPGTRGDEFLRQVRDKFPSTVRIMLTGQADDDAIRRAYDEAAVRRVFSKPWALEDLAAEIEAGLAP